MRPRDREREQELNCEDLTPQEEKFCVEVFKNRNLTESYKTAFPTEHLKPTSVSRLAAALYKRAHITQRLKQLRDVVTKQINFAAEDVFRRWVMIATADAAELARIRRVCCRNCHGDNFQHQWSEHEFQAASENAEKLKNPYPDCSGGFGFNPTLPPHPNCPYCFGEGTAEEFIEDTLKLSPSARALYDGFKKTNNGLEIKLQNRAAALENIAKMLDMFGGKKEDGNSKNNLLPLDELKNITNDPREAAAMYQQIITGK